MKNFKFKHVDTGDTIFTAKEKNENYYQVTWTDKNKSKDSVTFTKAAGDIYIAKGYWILEPIKIKSKGKTNNESN